MSCNFLYPNRPELYAMDIIDGFNFDPPIDPYFICDYFNVDILKDYLDDAEAFLIIRNGIKRIILNDSNIKYETRRRFTISHELGHYFIPWHSNFYKCNKNDISLFSSSDHIENEANEFASELLIPSKYIKTDILKYEITIENIKKLSNKYKVSLSAMSIKLLKMTDEPIVIIFYYKNGYKIIFKSSSFLWDIKNGKLNNSYADELFNNKNNSPRQYSGIVSSKVWIEGLDHNEELIEESLYMPKFKRVFTILRYAKSNENSFRVDDL